MKRQLDTERDERLFAEFSKAALDPRFVADNEQAMRDFKHVDTETARALPR